MTHRRYSAPETGSGSAPELPDFTMAFQPIVHAGGVYAHEALVRGVSGESAESLFAQLSPSTLYRFDQACRIRAIEMAAALSAAPPCISINFVPGAIYEPETCIENTMATAERVGMPLTSIILEVSETEKVTDRSRLVSIFQEYRSHGLKTAIDDFGAGYSGLDLLSDFQPEIIKLDIALVRDIDKRRASLAIVRAITSLCRELNVQTIAEGVETEDELLALQDLGLELFQGYFFARPALASFAVPLLPRDFLPDKQSNIHHPSRLPPRVHGHARATPPVALPF